ncbi:Sugar transferase involved in LPS biosynthesis (colanic, teichoic acid) [Sporolactobacillus nakayamae]|uniref:Sugar transferase involved in LPS biosynthesis (Colanic, teichoic acid) n=2 Tax=Sporolactobacillus nakayamae TaxID=269670 RepID=A0A1I2SXW5_9BACL|nr:sugar transferase [Sporolactobacillus nakayamae]SFG56759.1 Sugar transferase involved in LPS biosynthesis (colanic, teichoic acid) [Sporolactobacillus nakayamae]
MKAEKEIGVYSGYSMMTPPSVVLPEGVKTYLLIKRGFDLIFGFLGLVITAPIVFVFSLLIVLETPGSPFYAQERVGKGGKTFRLIKLRSMCKDAERAGAKWAEAHDPRVTRVGRFIRKTRIDELPQFFSVIKGDMSLIGPRPERPMFTEKFDHEIPGFKKRLLVKPGLTGLAQVSGGYDLSPKEKLVYDLAYVRNLSPALEWNILLRTVKVLVTGDGAR